MIKGTPAHCGRLGGMIKGRRKTGHILGAVLWTSWGYSKGATEDWAHLGGGNRDVLGA